MLDIRVGYHIDWSILVIVIGSSSACTCVVRTGLMCVRTCSVLLEPELAHELRVEGLEFTLEGFEDLHISLFGDCHCCARFFDED